MEMNPGQPNSNDNSICTLKLWSGMSAAICPKGFGCKNNLFLFLWRIMQEGERGMREIFVRKGFFYSLTVTAVPHPSCCNCAANFDELLTYVEA
eukprot:scaffold1837_cov120-Skeletonema_dohrnii-CCMP3373.AAC.3